MKATKILRVAKVEQRISEKVAKKMGTEGRYNIVTVVTEEQALVRDGMGQQRLVKIPQRQSGFVAWVDSPIPGREVSDFGADLKEGEFIAGDIVTRKVAKYFIPSSNGDVFENEVRGRYVNTASVVVIGDSSDEKEWEMDILRAFRQRNFLLLEAGDAGAPGGNLDTALARERTRMEGHDIHANLPAEMATASPEQIVAYSDNSAARQQDEGQNNR